MTTIHNWFAYIILLNHTAGRADYESKTPSFSSHGALVMLVPVLEVLLSGYHCIFFDVDIALVLDPVPFLAKGQSDLVTMVEMRSCPDSYTKTYHNSSSTTFPHKARKVNNAIESINWYTAEPNTGIQYVRSNDASIAFYTRWLARIISVNVMNDQKSLLRDFPHAVHSTDCLYGSYSDAVAVRHQQKPPLGHHLTHKSPNAAGHLHRHVQGQTQSQHGSNRNRLRWAANYTTLVEEVYLENEKPQPIKFCFVSELLFQNGQTAFTCGVKPSFKDSWILEMYKNGLQSTDEGTRNNMAAAHNGKRQIIEPAPNTPRFPVTVHANFCDKKTHELTVRGLWLVTQDSIDAVFNSSTCRTFDPLTTMYGTRNWTQEYLQVKHKRDYMYETFVQPGKLIQSTNGKEIFYVNEQRHKQLIPDKDTFIATVGDNKWSDVRYLPQPIMDSVPTGDPIPSVKKAQKLASELPTDASVLPASNSPPPPLPPHVTSPTTNPPLSGKVSKVSAPHALLTAEAPPPPQRKNQPQQKQEEQLSEQHVQPPKKFDSIILAGMLMRSESAATVFFIDKRLHKRRVPNMTVFTRLFGQRTKDIVIVPDAVLGAIPLGEPLL